MRTRSARPWILASIILGFGMPACWAQQDPASTDPNLTDVEYLLRLRDAEADFDEALEAAYLPTSTRIFPKTDPTKIADLANSAAMLLEQYDIILVSDKVNKLRKEQTRLKKLSFLYEAIRFARPTYEPILKQYVGEMFAIAQEEQGADRRLSGILAAFKLKDEFVDSDKPNEKVLAALDQFAREYPRSILSEQLYMARGQNLIETGDLDGAVEVYRAAKEMFSGDARMAIVDSLITRLELVGEPADISGPTLDGQEFNVADLKDRVILVDFWASWCGPCLDRFADLKRLHEKYHDQGLDIIGVTLDDDREEATAALAKYQAPWPHIYFEPAEGVGRSFANPLASRLSVHYLPAVFLVGKDGKYIGTDYARISKLEGDIVTALGLEAPIPNPAEPPADAPAADPAEPTPTP